MTTSSQTEAPTRTIECPAWCAARASDHHFEQQHGYPIEHFRWFHCGADHVPVALTRKIDLDGGVTTTIDVADDESFDVDQAEHTALAMLEAIKAARA